MNLQMTASAAVSGAVATADRRARPPRRVRCLLPVWGYHYVRRFLHIGLPTWLGEGNLPGLAQALPTEFVILTSRDDDVFFRTHPMFKRLCEVCDVRVEYIDHLITGTNYSTSITLAYLQGVRDVGDEMTDTCFFFLVSDYVVAAGSFLNVLKRMQAGASGVLVGNFQVVEEDALLWLQEQIDQAHGAASFTARELMMWGLSHLHPVTAASMVNYRFAHNRHANRFFWRVDNKTLIGRFFLMHMICVRPELTDFSIGASCDYSFIPEMCPSDNVEIIEDSDEYLVVELQPRNHETKYLLPRGFKPGRVARSLQEWTTSRHRKNSETTIIFHAEEIPEETTGKTIALADRFLRSVSRNLRRPRPHHGHPYWSGAIAAFKESTGATLNSEEYALALGIPHPELMDAAFGAWTIHKAMFALFGQPPAVRVWHPRWPDHGVILPRIKKCLGMKGSRLLLVSDRPTVYTASLGDSGERVTRLMTPQFLKALPASYEELHGQFDACLIELTENDLYLCAELFERVAPLMKDGGSLMLSVFNTRGPENADEFLQHLNAHLGVFLQSAARSTEYIYVGANWIRWRTLCQISSLGRRVYVDPMRSLPLLILGIPLTLVGWVANLTRRIYRAAPPFRGIVSSVLVVAEIDGETAQQIQNFSGRRAFRRRERMRKGYEIERGPPAGSDTARGRDVQELLAPGSSTAKPKAPAAKTRRRKAPRTKEKLRMD